MFSELPSGSEGGRTVSWGEDFWSCPCGSEVKVHQVVEFLLFLSCLCGKRRRRHQLSRADGFSELPVRAARPTRDARYHRRDFLSCLCGSEGDSALCPRWTFFELPAAARTLMGVSQFWYF